MPNNYNTYFPQTYAQYGNGYQFPATAAPAQQNNGIVWVQGEAGAKSYLVGAGQSVLLMDSEGSCFYIKSTDPSGMPMPLRVFDYTERTQKPKESSDYVTHEELKQMSDELVAMIRGERHE